MRCYFHYQHSCFIDYFDDPIPDGAGIYAGDILFHYYEKEGTYTVSLVIQQDTYSWLQVGAINSYDVIEVSNHMFHVQQFSPESLIAHTLTTLIPAQLPRCKCHSEPK